ncbi:sphingoid base-phosphate phosphatase [Morchella snyderi]|nr:sphingoid base-phosphate phosphatase [Morchella snyderi]
MGAAQPDTATEIEKGQTKVDAGLLPRDHYKYRLPRWRYMARQKLLPLVRWETPYLAYFQEHCRTPFLDSYFALTANLGTHTFFMIMLPVLFWFGYTTLGRGMVHILASGVFFSGFLKDLLCLPRPLSPPLHRITMSGSAALEYGFPSTHSTNAVSVALYGILSLRSTPDVSTTLRFSLEALAWVYAISIVLGRLYCGMHGFLDVIVGICLGAALAYVDWVSRDAVDAFVFSGSWQVPVVFIVAGLIMVRIHPEPADSCPCFDDGVAFAAVVMGCDVGHWHYAQSSWSWNEPVPATVPYSYEELGLTKSVLRVIAGVCVIFAWREFMKPTLHHFLPPLYRVIESIGLSLPRKHFTPASEYKKVPRLPDDTLFGLSELPALIHNFRRPRSDSVGPQSAADAYETLAYREKKRRESIGTSQPRSPSMSRDLAKYENEMGNGDVDVKALVVDSDDEKAEAEVFRKIERPRVRYDVEVVTKLVVYAGIAWFAVEGIPIFLEIIGLGIASHGFEAK